MRTLILGVLLLVPAVARATQPTGGLKSDCDLWIAAQDPQIQNGWTGDERIKKVVHGAMCQAYIYGLANEMTGELSWLDDSHKKVVAGNWEDAVTLKQQILVFVDYVNQNPASLNKSANVVFRQSMEAAKLYAYAAP